MEKFNVITAILLVVHLWKGVVFIQYSWEEILERFDKNKFLPWIWPDKKNLEFIGKSVRNQNSENLISIGCGSGLLEWLLKMATGLKVIGIEIDKTWWNSKYSSGTFIPLTVVDDSTRGEFHLETRGSVLLFCYFNNEGAFSHYLYNFEGDCFIVIGPGPGRGTYTIPEPFRLPEGLDENWELFDQKEIRSSKDFIAVYVRKRQLKAETLLSIKIDELLYLYGIRKARAAPTEK